MKAGDRDMTDLRREILYKGKQKVSGNWIEGVPIRHSDGEWQIHGGYSNAGWLVTVIPETICQYSSHRSGTDDPQCGSSRDRDSGKIYG